MKENLRLFKKMKRRMLITWICWGVAMVVYPLAAKTVGGFPLWVVGWLASLIGWWSWCHHATPLTGVITEEIKTLENKGQEETP